jgi:hypothetical protein
VAKTQDGPEADRGPWMRAVPARLLPLMIAIAHGQCAQASPDLQSRAQTKPTVGEMQRFDERRSSIPTCMGSSLAGAMAAEAVDAA